MFESSIVRIVVVLLLMLLVGFGRYGIGYAGLRKRVDESPAAKKQLRQSAKKYSLITAFLYMVAMVSVAGLFM